MTTRTTRGLVALGLVLAAALSGCGAEEGDDVASASGTTATSTEQLSEEEQAVKFAQCLREHGIEVEDPVDGQMPAVPQGAATDEELEAAEEACREYQGGTPKTKQVSEEDLAKLREMSQCMRDHGYPNFPDPDPDKGGIILGDDSGIDLNDPKVQQAQQECGMEGTPVGDGEMRSEGDG
jgi:hypothetical protein